ncbi:cytochrome P450 [Coprinellus micaceus]|uniref:Cytochrome P450 n=1 Tax=Coprinellus micaceus TaxID=71717 RepID=A0A4Y7R820_COPMI|nr:cytochrome P450 [Coprinellus micaceus]
MDSSSSRTSLVSELHSAPYSFLGFTAPVTWWNPGLKFLWEGRKDHYLYKYFGSENFSHYSMDIRRPSYRFLEPRCPASNRVWSFRSDFEKPEEMSRALLFWGDNLAGTDGEILEETSPYRKTLHSTISSSMGKDRQSCMSRWRDAEGWGDKDTIDIEVVQKLTHKFTLLIISTCGFGLDLTGLSRLPLRTVTRNMAVTFMPRWVHKLVPTTYFREVDEAINRDVQVHESSSYISQGSRSLWERKPTAVTLAAAMIYLALNPEIEKEVLQNIIEVVGWNGKPTFEDYGKLDKVLAVFLEVLRMYPCASGHLMFRKATKDTTLKLPRPVGEEGADTIPIAKGTMMVIDMVGLQYNPRYFEDPESFKPSRWSASQRTPTRSPLSVSNVSYNLGPRECIGRKFATVEAVALLALLLRDFKIEPLLLNGETLDAWKTRVLDAQLLITLGVSNASVRFVRRQKGTASS